MSMREMSVSIPKTENYYFDEGSCTYKPLVTSGVVPVSIVEGLNLGGGKVNFLYGVTLPTDALGEDGDVYLDTSTCNLYKKESSTWLMIANLKGGKGDKGDVGESGATWLFRDYAPTTHGKHGDFFINTSTFDVYNKNSSDVWIRIGNIKGAKGDVGFGTEEQYNDIIARLEALENSETE